MFKKALTIFCVCGLSTIAQAQLIIYPDLQQGGVSQVCQPTDLYIGANIPAGLNNNFKSIKLTHGYMATLADHEDGTGESFNYVAATSDITVDLAAVLQNKISFIRVLPIGNIKKKGAGGKDNDVIAALKPAWFYDWGNADVSTTDKEYVPMSWGLNAAANLTSVNAFTVKTDVNSFLGFNEPDNSGQANIAYATAVPAYKNLLRTGYRMGSPATTEGQYNKWLASFMSAATADTIRVDFVAIHWYDWGNWGSQSNASPDAANVLDRFKAYINNVYNLYKKPIWITEFNANTNRTTATQQAFMTLALPYLESDSRVERYAWFFDKNSPASVSRNLTPLGQIYSDHVSSASFAANIIDDRSTNIAQSDQNLVFNGDFENTTSYLASWEPSFGTDFKEETTNAINTTTVRFASASNERFLTSDAIPVVPGKTYQLQFTARIQSATGPSGSPGPTKGGVFSADILDGSDLAVTTFTTLSTTSSTNTILSGNYTVPAGQTSVKLRFTKTADIAYLDDVSIVEFTNLPVKLTSFTANPELSGIDLKWKTANENNNDYFTLYHSSDGKTFSKKATIASLGSSVNERTYHFLDNNPSKGANYYQLSQTDFDGKTEIFGPIAIDFTLKDQHNLTIYSNPFQIKFNIYWDLNELVTINIFDTFGKKVFSSKNQLNAGDNLVTLNTLKQLNPSQFYVFTVSGVADKLAIKLVVNPQ